MNESYILKFLRKIFSRNLPVVGTRWRDKRERGNPFSDTGEVVLAVDNGWVQLEDISLGVTTSMTVKSFLALHYQLD